jgi:uncharacterized Fe-S cluster protein YjdI
MSEIIKHYSNGEITIVWKPSVCIHSTRCWKGEEGLLDVFNPREKPWIKPQGADTQRIINQIKKCPSGALSYTMNDAVEKPEEVSAETIIETAPNGPLMVYGNITIKDKEGNPTQRHKVTAFCRCGASANKPFCDGTHAKIGFVG